LITDCHVHIQPLEMLRPQALELLKKNRANFDDIREFSLRPKAFLKYLDQCGVDRAVLINYVAPEIMGFTAEVNPFIADYVTADPSRLSHAEDCTRDIRLASSEISKRFYDSKFA